MKILLVNDHPVARKGMRSVLESGSGYEVAEKLKMPVRH